MRGWIRRNVVQVGEKLKVAKDTQSTQAPVHRPNKVARPLANEATVSQPKASKSLPSTDSDTVVDHDAFQNDPFLDDDLIDFDNNLPRESMRARSKTAAISAENTHHNVSYNARLDTNLADPRALSLGLVRVSKSDVGDFCKTIQSVVAKVNNDATVDPPLAQEMLLPLGDTLAHCLQNADYPNTTIRERSVALRRLLQRMYENSAC